MAKKRLWWMVAALAIVVVGAGIGQLPAQGAKKGPRRTIFMSAVEYKGSANVADEAYPPAEAPGTLPLEPLGGGYRLKAPDGSGKWEVSSYRWEPGLVVVNKGDRVTLEIAGINGALHDAQLVTPGGKALPLTVTRGRLSRLSFTASKAGLYRLVCGTHPPGMVANIWALA